MSTFTVKLWNFSDTCVIFLALLLSGSVEDFGNEVSVDPDSTCSLGAVSVTSDESCVFFCA